MTEPATRQYRDRGLEHLLAGDLRAALKEYTSLLRIDPNDLTVRKRVAEINLKLGRKHAALGEYAQVVDAYAARGFFITAIGICKVMLEIEPDNPTTQRRLLALSGQQRRRGEFSLGGVLEDVARQLPPTAPAPPPRAEPAAAAREEEPELPPPIHPQIPQAGAFLPSTPLFSDLSPAAFAALVQRLELRSVDPGELVVVEGDPGDAMFVVAHGLVKVWRHPEPGLAHQRERRRLCVAELSQGAFFGEIAVLSSSPRLATVTAAQPTLLLVVPRATLEDLAREHAEVGEVVQRFYHERLLLNLFAANPMFRRFDADAQREIIAAFEFVSLRAGETVCEQGKPPPGLFVLMRGDCDAGGLSADGAHLTYPGLRAGDVIGEISLLRGGPATATVTARGSCLLLRMPPDDARRLILAHQGVREELEALVKARLDRTEMQEGFARLSASALV